jgi:hypothetical protein
MATIEQISRDIDEVLRTKSNNSYTLLINNKLLQVARDSNSSKRGKDNKTAIRVSYIEESNGDKGFQLGHLERINNRSRFIPDYNLKESFLKIITDTRVFGLDLGISQDDLNIEIEINQAFRLINIKQSTYMELFNKIYVEDTEKISFKNGRTISIQERNYLYTEFDTSSMSSYLALYDKIISGHLRRTGRKDIRNFYIFDVWRPLFISGPCVFNPILEVKRYRPIREESKLFSKAKEYQVSYESLDVYFCSDKDISESLNFSKVIRLSTGFVLNILLGLLNQNFPNVETDVYSPKDTSYIVTLTRKQWLELDESQRGLFVSNNSLFYHCVRNTLQLGFSTPDDLYNIVYRARIL